MGQCPGLIRTLCVDQTRTVPIWLQVQMPSSYVWTAPPVWDFLPSSHLSQSRTVSQRKDAHLGPLLKSPGVRQDRRTHRASSCSRCPMCTVMALGSLRRGDKRRWIRGRFAGSASLLLKSDSSEQRTENGFYQVRQSHHSLAQPISIAAPKVVCLSPVPIM